MRLRRLAREQGFALPLALGITIVTSIMLVTIVEFTTSNTRSASRGKGGMTAFSLAEAGLNNALAVLFKPNANVVSQSLMPACTGAEDTWNATPYDGGEVHWCGTVDMPNGVWRLTSVGVVENPTGPGAGDVRRTLSAEVPIISQPTTSNQADAWNYLFATRTGTPGGCDLTFSNNVAIGANVYANGNLCLDQNVVITAPKVIVMGKIQIENNGRIGQSGTSNWSTRVEVQVGGSGGDYCQYSSQHWHGSNTGDGHPWCGDVDHVYSKNSAQTAMTVNFTPSQLEQPAPQWDTWYEGAAPGPKIGCTTSSGTVPTWDNNSTRDANNGSVGTVFDLTPASASYSCIVGPTSAPIGELSWNHTTKLLTLLGTIYIDGSARITNTAVHRYTGYATLYLSGTFLMDNGAKLCAKLTADGTDCDYAGWDPNSTMVAVIADGDGSIAGAGSQTGSTTDGGGNGIKLVNNVRFQGAVQATNAIQLQNNGRVDGPMIGETIVVDNNVTPDSFPTITTVPSGLPGNDAMYAQPQPPQKFSG